MFSYYFLIDSNKQNYHISNLLPVALILNGKRKNCLQGSVLSNTSSRFGQTEPKPPSNVTIKVVRMQGILIAEEETQAAVTSKHQQLSTIGRKTHPRLQQKVPQSSTYDFQDFKSFFHKRISKRF